MRRIARFAAVPFVLSAFLFFMTYGSAAQARYAAIVLDANTGRVLHAANPDTRNYPASLTKMMTLYMVFEALESGRLKLGTPLTVSKRAEGMSPSKLGLKAGESITVEAAILALVTKSANDAAVVVAEGLGGTEVKFARMMTDKAKNLGMRRTTFRNASGLPNRGQMSTARDMATLAQHLIRDFPQYYSYFSRSQYTFQGKAFKNHNNLLKNFPGTDGIKTGYIRASGFNLAASVARDDQRLIGVVFGGKSARSRDQHMQKLLERGFAKLARDREVEVAEATRFAKLSRRKMAAPPKELPKPPETRPAVTAELPTPPIKPAQIARGDGPGQAEAPAAAPETVALDTAPTTTAGNWAGSESEWAIQVGAYGDIGPARAAAKQAVSRVPNLTENTFISISPYHAGERLMYRARLIGMSRDSAHAACRRLEQGRIPCIAIAPENANPNQTTDNSQTATTAQ